MRTYEALYVIRPDKTDDEAQTIAKGVETLITDNGGAIVRSEIWGKRRLAYVVNKFNDGIYVLVRFQLSAANIEKLGTLFRLSEDIIRSLIKLFDAKTLRLEVEQQRRNEAALQARSAASADGDDDDEEEDDFAARRGGRRRPAGARADDDD